MQKIFGFIACLLISIGTAQAADSIPPKGTDVPFTHEGGLFTLPAYEEMAATIESGEKLLTYTASPSQKLIRGGKSKQEPLPDNYQQAQADITAAYQLAILWKGTREIRYGQAAIDILNAWAATCKTVSGDTHSSLAAGDFGFRFAAVAEIMRGFPDWSKDDFAAFQFWIYNTFIPKNREFLTYHYRVCDTHYFAEWDLCNLASMLAIGILTDNHEVYNFAVDYLQNGTGNGNLNHAINYVHQVGDEELAQLQVSGESQTQAMEVISLIGNICQLTWSQGEDFYGYRDNLFLKACEYTAKYNFANQTVPFHPYTRIYAIGCQGKKRYAKVSPKGRGTELPCWSAPLYHYIKVKGVAEEKVRYTQMAVEGAASCKFTF